MSSGNRLFFKIVPIKDLTPMQIQRMWDVFSRYYEGSSLDIFQKDLSEKNDVVLLMDHPSKTIQGFSTLLVYEENLGPKKVRVIFSGDTVIEKEYWGQKILQTAFCWYLAQQKLKSPLTPLYWFLISKGYKTYLLLSNYFGEFYPRHDAKTPGEIQMLIDRLAISRFGSIYDSKKGLVVFEKHDHLKEGIAPITEQMKKKNPHIRFFEEKNPNWLQGDELVCLGRFGFSVVTTVTKKFLKKRFS